MRLLDDCLPFANRHRGKYVTSGPHWSLIIRFVKLFDYACQMEAALNEIADFSGDATEHANFAIEVATKALKGGEK